ncbi:MAG: OmpH family outer membrane protein, partial [Mailhella sp.]|nr:OmpH family outer membrane protein [Mailhella sp.]
MKKHILPIIAITSMLCMFHDSPALADQPAIPFGIVQITKVYQESQGARLAAERTNQLQKAAAEKLQSIKDDLEKANAANNKELSGKLQKEYDAHIYFYQNVLKQEQEHVFGIFQGAVTNAMEKYRKEHHLSAIFSAEYMMSFAPEADITAPLIELLDAEKIEYGELPSLTMPPLPEPANAAAPKAEGKSSQSA